MDNLAPIDADTDIPTRLYVDTAAVHDASTTAHAAMLASATPQILNVLTGNVGTGTKFARDDHRHQVLVGNPVALGTLALGGSASSLARSDHQHPFPTAAEVGAAATSHTHAGTYEAAGAVATHAATAGHELLSSTAPAALASAAAVGVGTTVARADHVHIYPTPAQIGAMSQATADTLYLKLTGGTMTGNIAAPGFTSTGGLAVTRPKDSSASLEFQTAGVTRWTMGKGPAPESTGNAGAEFNIAAWNDAGVWISNPLSIARATGNITMSGTLAVTGAIATSGTLSAMTSFSLGGAGGYVNITGTGGVGVYWAAADMFLNNYNGSTTTLYLLNAGASAWKDLQIGNLTVNGNTTTTGNTVCNARFIGNGTGANGSASLGGYGVMYTGYTNGGVAGANYIGLSWRSPNLVGGADNANTMVLGTVSNRRWKADIQSLSNTRAKGGAGALDEVEQLNVVEYSPVDVDGTVLDERHRGLITDEVKPILPGAVVGDDPDNDSLNYMEIVPTLVAAIQELSAKVKMLEAQVA